MVENTLKKQANYQITLHTYKIVSNSLKKRSNETISLIIRFLEEEDMKFFQRLGQLDKLHSRNILTMTKLTFQSSGHQVKCLSPSIWMKVIKYLTIFVNTALSQISLKMTRFCVFEGNHSKHNHSTSLGNLSGKSINTWKLQELYCMDVFSLKHEQILTHRSCNLGKKSQKCSKD